MSRTMSRVSSHILKLARYGLRAAVLAGLLAVPATAQDGEHDDDVVRLTRAELEALGGGVEGATGGALSISVSLPGEVVPNPDRIAHIVPRVPGVAHEVRRAIGDAVVEGDTLAVLVSRELSELKSEFLVARERAKLALATFEREERLLQSKVSSEREYLMARQDHAAAQIEERAAEQKLQAIGFSRAQLRSLGFVDDDAFLHYAMTAPFDGVIIEKHISRGEFVRAEDSAFVLADLSEVWVELTVYQQDLPLLRAGSKVHIVDTRTSMAAAGVISYISPVLSQATRTATARVVLVNNGDWRPGLFIEGFVVVEERPARVLVPRNAVQAFEGRTVVFVETEEGYRAHPVEVGDSNSTHAEIRRGLEPGQPYVVTGAFTLRAQLEKGAFGDGHNH